PGDELVEQHEAQGGRDVHGPELPVEEPRHELRLQLHQEQERHQRKGEDRRQDGDAEPLARQDLALQLPLEGVLVGAHVWGTARSIGRASRTRHDESVLRSRTRRAVASRSPERLLIAWSSAGTASGPKMSWTAFAAARPATGCATAFSK